MGRSLQLINQFTYMFHQNLIGLKELIALKEINAENNYFLTVLYQVPLESNNKVKNQRISNYSCRFKVTSLIYFK